jgi:hypothetical protein
MGNKVRLELGKSMSYLVKSSVGNSVKWSMTIRTTNFLHKGWDSIRTPINNLMLWRIDL